MSFAGRSLLLVGLCKIVLPNHTIRVCDGGFFTFEGDVYRADDPDFGKVVAVESFAAGAGTAPGGSLTFAPKSTAIAALLSSPGYQGSRVELYQNRYDQGSGALIRSKRVFFGKIDYTLLRGSGHSKLLEIGVHGEGDWLFSQNEGNNLNPQFHKSSWPNELGLDHVTDVTVPVAWGAASAAQTERAETATAAAIQRFF